MHVNFKQQRAIDCKRQDVAALDACLAGLDAMLQVKRGIERVLSRCESRQQLFGCSQGQLGVNRVIFAAGLGRVQAYAQDFCQKDQLVGLQCNRH